MFQAGGIRILASPPQAPRANAICERVTVTLRRELPGRLLLVDEHHLRRVLTEDLRHCKTARPHRALSKLASAQARVRPPEINLAAHRIHRNQCWRAYPRVPGRHRTAAGCHQKRQVTATVMY